MLPFIAKFFRAGGLLALALLAGCGDQASARAALEIDTLASGAIVARSGRHGLWKPEQAWRLHQELSIGSTESAGPTALGNVVDIAVDRLGRLWVADAQAHQIRVFDSSGRHVRSLGRSGGGPGEFKGIAGMDWGPDGHLWVMDGGNSRYSVFDSTGKFVASHPRPAGVTMVPWPGGFDSQGRLYDISVIPGARGAVDLGISRYDARMQPAGTFRIPEYKGEFFEAVSRDGLNRSRANVPFTANQVWRLDPSGDVWIGVTDRYRLQKVSFAGDTLRVVERDYAPVPVTDADIEEVMQSYRWFTDKGGRVDLSRVPDAKPAFVAMFVDDTGHLWVQPEVARGDSTTAFDVFDPEGRYLGVVRSPVRVPSTPAPVVRGGIMYAVSRDELDTPRVLRLRIEKP